MCSVTFIPTHGGFVLGMNRDEQLTRPKALPPVFHNLKDCRALFPSEPGGGTWIGINQYGVTLALLNWYSVKARVTFAPVSRGSLVRSLLTVRTSAELESRLVTSELSIINPFRLLAVFPSDQIISEWDWDLAAARGLSWDWRPRAWFSSGLDEAGAQRAREHTFRTALLERSSNDLAWLRRLHSSHCPAPGPYSYCMHRREAATVSYTEISYFSGEASMRYAQGLPCSRLQAASLSRPVRLTTLPGLRLCDSASF